MKKTPWTSRCWTSDEATRGLPAERAGFVTGARRNYAAIKDKVKMMKPGDEVVTGLQIVDTPGHTQGHVSLALGGGGGLLGYGGLNRSLAIEFDTWHNADMGDLYYNHVSVQAGGPTGPVGAHKEHYLSASIADPATYPAGIADGKAHVVRVRYTPGVDPAAMKEGGPSASPQSLKYWVHEGPIGSTAP